MAKQQQSSVIRAHFPLAKHTVPPKPGFYKSVPNDEYQLWNAASGSRLGCLIDDTPAYLQHQILSGSEETDAKLRGTLLHAAMLEPARFAKEYAVGPDVNLSTKIGKAEWGEFKSANPNKTLVRGKDGEKIIGMRASLWKHPLASQLLRSVGDAELSLSWIDERTGVQCKGRLDRLLFGRTGERIIDLKKTTCVSPFKFTSTIYDYGYYYKAAHYLDGMEALKRPVRLYSLIAVEETPPYAVCIVSLSQEAIDYGRSVLREALDLYAKCCAEKEWPGHGYNWQHRRYEAVKMLSMPWRMKSKVESLAKE